MAAAPQQMSPQQQNAMVRQLILRGGVLGNMYFPPSVDMWQQLNPILPASVGPGSVITIQLRNVGLVKRLVVELSAQVNAGATSVQTLTPLGLANLISNVTFIDLGNNTRVMYAPTTIAANANSPVRFMLEVPFIKNNHDLRGAIFGDVTNAVMQVQITLNPQMFVSSTADP